MQARYSKARHEATIILEDREDCVNFINSVASKMNENIGSPVILRIKVEDNGARKPRKGD